MPGIRWVDLSPYKARLQAVQFPDGRKRLVIAGLQPHGPLWDQCIEKLGFRPAKNRRSLLRENLKVEYRAICRVFPRASVVDMPIESILKDAPGAGDEAGGSRVETVNLQTAQYLGRNFLGQQVHEGAAGRFTHNPDNVVTETDASDAAIFLRAPDRSSLARCADGFVNDMVRGKVMKASDLAAFIKTITPAEEHRQDFHGPGWPRLVGEAVEAAIQRRVAAYAAESSPEKVFQFAARLYDRQPPLTARTSSSVTKQQFSSPPPLAVLAQGVLTADAAGDMTVLEPTIGNGSLVMSAPGDARVFGVEIDPERVERARSLRQDAVVVAADATVYDFASLHPAGEKFDYVITNPPFGGLQSPIVYNKLRVTRLDHLILMRSLAARKPEGRGVFIIAADRENIFPGKEGVISGGSEKLFNWLADHYELESAFELTSKLYAKQGATTPVRVVVVGRQRSPEEAVRALETKEFRVGRLPVVHSWEEVGEQMLPLIERLRGARVQPAVTDEVAQQDDTRPPEDSRVMQEQDDNMPPPPPPPVEPSRPVPGEAPVGMTSIDPAREQEEADLLENAFQVPYSGLANGETNSMVPRNLYAPTQIALERLNSRIDVSVEDFVIERLGNSGINRDNISDFLSPEQVDAVALAITRFEAGQGFLVGDMTGLGKGRILAALALYSVNTAGREVVFLSDKKNLFSDFWRDLQDLCGPDLDAKAVFQPVILNSDAEIRDLNSNTRIQAPTTPAERKALMESDSPNPLQANGYNMLFATYSQFNRDPAKSAKAAWLPVIARDNVLILDESHNAAGHSNTAENIKAALHHSWASIYSSATAIKTGDHMAAYWKAFPAGVCNENLPEILSVGGEPLQEIISGMLVEDGGMVRREHDLSRLTFDTYIDKERLQRNEDLSDRLSSILLQMSHFAGDVNDICKGVNKEIQKRLKDMPEEMRKGERMNVSSVNFGSRLYNILRQFMMAASVDATLDEATRHLKEGRKPVIVVEQTMETLLRETLADLDAEVDGAGAVEVSALGQSMPVLTFRDLLYRVLDRLQVIVERNDYGNVDRRRVESFAKNKEQAEALAAVVNGLRKDIGDFPDLPLSPLDTIRHQLAQQGYKCGELSGRSLQVEFRTDENGEEQMVATPRIDDRLRAIHNFNHGQLDAIIITRAGSTGLSLHASEKFSDQRQRVLLEQQIPNNVADRVQFFGRVNRKGQVNEPLIETISTGLPAQNRILAMQNHKLRRLSANTQSDGENPAEMRDIPDILNHVGDKICRQFLFANPKIAQMLDIKLDFEENTDSTDEHGGECWFANKLTGRIALLPIADQKHIYEELFREYQAFLEEAEMQGDNPFKTKEYDLHARVVNRTVFEGVEKARYQSVFDKPVYLATIEWDEVLRPVRWGDLCNMIDAGKYHGLSDPRISTADAAAPGPFNVERICEIVDESFISRRDAALAVKGCAFADLDAAMAAKEPNVIKNIEGRRKQLTHLARTVQPGNIIETQFEGELGTGIVTSVKYPDAGKEHLPGRYEVETMRPGRSVPDRFTFNMLMTHGCIRLPYLDSSRHPPESMFNEAPSGKVTRSRAILEGNLFKAAQIAAQGSMGRAAVYTDEHGARQRAIVLKGSITQDMVLSTQVRIEDPVVVAKLFDERPGIQITTEPMATSKGLTLLRHGDDTFSMSCAGTKGAGGRFFTDAALNELVGEFAGNRSQMRARFGAEKLPDVLDRLAHMGCLFYVSPKFREVVQDIQVTEEERKSKAAETATKKEKKSQGMRMAA